MLSLVLAPWHRLVGAHGAGHWSYVDDRSLKTGTLEDLQSQLEVTEQFDAAVGLTENDGKRQLWAGSGAAEHLGVVAQPASGLRPALPPPRDGWGPVVDAARRARVVPGGAELREQVVKWALNKYMWAAPFVEHPPAALAKECMKAISAQKSTWWCTRRFWADWVLTHPSLALACRALQAARGLPWSRMLEVALDTHCSKLGLPFG